MTDHELWIEFLKAAIAGTNSREFSGSAIPLVEWCAKVADEAVKVEHRRRGEPEYYLGIFGERK